MLFRSAGHFTDPLTGYQHTGLVRQASTNTWKLFSNVTPEPGGTIDFTNAVYDSIQVGNIISPTVDLLNANAQAQQTQINTINDGMVNYAWNANLTAANIGMQGYVDAVTSAWQANASSQQTQINNLIANSYSNVNVSNYLPTYAGTVGASLLQYAP